MREPSSLRWKRWEDDFVIYHVPSGDTHLIDAALGTALQRLLEGPAGLAELTTHVAAHTVHDAGPELSAHLAGALASLEELGVLEHAA